MAHAKRIHATTIIVIIFSRTIFLFGNSIVIIVVGGVMFCVGGSVDAVGVDDVVVDIVVLVTNQPLVRGLRSPSG